MAQQETHKRFLMALSVYWTPASKPGLTLREAGINLNSLP